MEVTQQFHTSCFNPQTFSVCLHQGGHTSTGLHQANNYIFTFDINQIFIAYLHTIVWSAAHNVVCRRGPVPVRLTHQHTHAETHSHALTHIPTDSYCCHPGPLLWSMRQIYEIQALESLTPVFTKQCRCRESERTMYVCHSVRLLIPFVIAATLLTMHPSVLRILLEGCRRLSGTDPFDSHILRVSKCGDKRSGKHAHILCVCLCVWWQCLSVFVCMAAWLAG